jgi:hypothetical protein
MVILHPFNKLKLEFGESIQSGVRKEVGEAIFPVN